MAQRTKQSFLEISQEMFQQPVGSGCYNSGSPTRTGAPSAVTPSRMNASLSRLEHPPGFQLDAISALIRMRHQEETAWSSLGRDNLRNGSSTVTGIRTANSLEVSDEILDRLF